MCPLSSSCIAAFSSKWLCLCVVENSVHCWVKDHEMHVKHVKYRMALVFAVLGCVVGAVAVWRFVSTKPSQSGVASVPRIDQHDKRRAQSEPDEPTLDETGTEALQRSVIDAGFAAGVPDADQLGKAVAATISAYALPQVESYVDWQISEGIKPVPKWEADPERFQSVWDKLRATFAYAAIDETRVRVVRRTGHTDRSNEATSQVKMKTRPEGRPFLDGSQGALEVWEVLLPGLYPTLDGDVAEAELGIEMTKRPDTGDWVITGITHYADKFPPPRIAIPPL